MWYAAFPGWGGWSDKVHAMIKFQKSWTYEKGDIRLTLKTEQIIIKGQIFVDL